MQHRRVHRPKPVFVEGEKGKFHSSHTKVAKARVIAAAQCGVVREFGLLIADYDQETNTARKVEKIEGSYSVWLL